MFAVLYLAFFLAVDEVVGRNTETSDGLSTAEVKSAAQAIIFARLVVAVNFILQLFYLLTNPCYKNFFEAALRLKLKAFIVDKFIELT